MAIREVTYVNRAQRQALIDAAEASGEVMLHDEIRGESQVLVFGDPSDLPPPSPTPPFVPDPSYTAATTVEERLDVIARRLGLIE